MFASHVRGESYALVPPEVTPPSNPDLFYVSENEAAFSRDALPGRYLGKSGGKPLFNPIVADMPGALILYNITFVKLCRSTAIQETDCCSRILLG